MTDDLKRVEISIARVEERQINAIDRLTGIAEQLNTFATKEDLKPLADRITAVEGTQTWIVRSAVGLAATIVTGSLAVGKKFGLFS